MLVATVCLLLSFVMALNISVGSYIKYSLHSDLPLMLSVSFSKSKCRLKYQKFGSTLIMNQNANLVAFSSTFCIYATVLHDSYHTPDMILYLHSSLTQNNRMENPKKQKRGRSTM